MTGREDTEAVEAAELEALRAQAELRRSELAGTLEALTTRVAADMDPGRLARRAGQRATAALGRAATRTVREAGSSRAIRAAAIAAPAGLAAAAGLWWLASRRGRGGAAWRGPQAARLARPAVAVAWRWQRRRRRAARRGR